MATRNYQVRITGVTPLLMHQDSIQWTELVDRWLKIPENKKASKAGDDRTPAWKWLGSMYHDTGSVCVPADNLMTALREGASKVTRQGKETYKKLSQSMLLVNEVAWPVQIDGKVVPFTRADLEALCDEPNFETHEKWALDRGFSLFQKRAKIGQNKHIRVRPRFEAGWVCEGSMTVLDTEIIDDQVVQDIWRMAGSLCGLCDWRPSSPSAPGQFGRFTVELS